MHDDAFAPAGTVTLRFDGARSGTAPLTWAQREMWELCQQLRRNDHYFNLSRQIDVPEGNDLPAVLAAVRRLVERHETLRTTVRRGAGGELYQDVARSGMIDVDLYEAGAGDPPVVGEWALTEQLSVGFEDSSLPLRIAVVTQAGKPVQLAVTVSHVMADRWGFDVACQELVGYLTEPEPEPEPKPEAGAEAEVVASRARQPFEQAEFEASPAGQRVADRSCDYWRRTLATVPQTLFPVARREAAAGWSPAGELTSRALPVIAGALAVRHRTSPSAVILSAVMALLGAWTGNRTVVVQLVSANRFQPALRDAVGSHAQRALCAVELRQDAGFHDLMGLVWTASLSAYRHAHYPVERLAEVFDEVQFDRGVRFDLGVYFNDLTNGLAAPVPSSTVDAEAVAVLAQRTSYRRSVLPNRRQQFRVDMTGRYGSSLLLRLAGDPTVFANADIELLSRGVERLLVRALQGDFSLADVPALTDVEPPGRPATVVSVDNCWVEPDEVRRLLADVPGVLAARVDLVVGEAGEARIAGHVLAESDGLTPSLLHRSCMDGLAGRTAALAPHEYLVHVGRADGGTWHDTVPVRHRGSGRVR